MAGRLDAVALSASERQARRFAREGVERRRVSPIATSLGNKEWAAVSAGDFNADGKTDLAGIFAVPSYPSVLASMGVLLSQGRSFAALQSPRTDRVDLSSVQIDGRYEVGDVNGDGVPDAVIVGPDLSGNWSIQVFLMNHLQ